MATYFLSDLHLNAERPAIVTAFLKFLDEDISDTDTLYLLGDVFDLYLGDDDDRAPNAEVKAALRASAARGTSLLFMAGNHDFLMQEGFHEQTGCTLIADPTVIDLNGRKAVLLHGDTLCTDDTAYQAYRAQVRSPQFSESVLQLPLAERLQKARQIQAASQAQGASKSTEIMDVNAAAVVATFDKYGVDLMIHGHTHRPAVHRHALADGTGERIVLAPWFAAADLLIWDNHEFTHRQLEL